MNASLKSSVVLLKKMLLNDHYNLLFNFYLYHYYDIHFLINVVKQVK